MGPARNMHHPQQQQHGQQHHINHNTNQPPHIGNNNSNNIQNNISNNRSGSGYNAVPPPTGYAGGFDRGGGGGGGGPMGHQRQSRNMNVVSTPPPRRGSPLDRHSSGRNQRSIDGPRGDHKNDDDRKRRRDDRDNHRGSGPVALPADKDRKGRGREISEDKLRVYSPERRLSPKRRRGGAVAGARSAVTRYMVQVPKVRLDM